MPVSISYEVLPKWKEYERASTTIADAYLKPVVEPAAARDARPARRGRDHRAGRRHQVERRRDDAGGRGQRAGPHGGVGPDRRRHRQPARGGADRHPSTS